MNNTEVWIINGIPGSGKSTTAKALAKRLPYSACIEGDAIQDLIISGKVSPGQEPKDEENRQIHLCITNQCLLANSLAEANFTPVIDYVIVNSQRIEEYRRQLKDAVILLVTLNPGIQTALDRDAKRQEKTVGDVWVHLEEEIRNGLAGKGLWVDNKNMSVDEVVTFILEHKEEAVV